MFADDLVCATRDCVSQAFDRKSTNKAAIKIPGVLLLGKKNCGLVTVRNRREKRPPASASRARVKGERGSKVDWSIDKIENARSLPLLMNERLVNIVTAGGS